MMPALRILYLEDDPTDAALVEETLRAGSIVCELTRVETRDEFLAALERGGFDVILADYSLPTFDGITALELTQKKRVQVPFIFVSGRLGEEVAIDALKVGATDYVLKTRLARLVPSVQRALREAHERAELMRVELALRRSEAYLAEAQRISHTGSFGWDIASQEIRWSRETFRIFEIEPQAPGTVTPALVLAHVHPDDRTTVREAIERIAHDRLSFDLEHRLLLKSGKVKYIRVVGQPSTSEARGFEIVGAISDITDRKNAEQVRLEERSRIARDLHDTLLQEVQGLMMLFQVAHDVLPARPLEAKALLVKALQHGRAAIAGSRDAVQDLHFATVQDLIEGITACGKELAVEEEIAGVRAPPIFNVTTTGAPRTLPLAIHGEVYHIGLEAVRNAFRHSAAGRIDVEITYADPALEIRVRDNGRGMDAAIQTAGGRPGHWGINGMRERALRIGATLNILSHPGSGTEVALSLPWARA